ncbi:MAG: MOSC domain-containing protein [Ahrensia sp.]|nr:MOSC domain-containing protein [Ahrensia sp.]
MSIAGTFTMAHLLGQFAQVGKVEWIGIRTLRRAPMTVLGECDIADFGLVGDHRTKPGKRAVSLIQAEHLPVIASLVGCREVSPGQLRRNIVVSGINLLALKDATFKLGTATLKGTGLCAPCSRMEEEFGSGGYNAVRGHGGIIATVVEPGFVKLGDEILPLI